MTLVIGIKCRNGVVVAADGAATLGSLYQPTVIQPTRKLYAIDDRVIVGFAGAFGLAQLYQQHIESMWTENKLSRKDGATTPEFVRMKVSEGLRSIAEREFAAANAAGGVLGINVRTLVDCQFLMAIPVQGQACLFEFSSILSSEGATDQLPFFCIGSGQKLADPFLGFIRRAMWGDQLPDIHQGEFAAYWTLEHAITLNTGGVADPKQILVLEEQGRGAKREFKVRELTKEDMTETQEAICALEARLAEFCSPEKGKEEELPAAVPP